MKQKESVFLFVLRLSVTLLLITSITAALLAGVNQITKDRIAEIQAQKVQEAIALVLPGESDIQTLAALPQETEKTVRKIHRAASGACAVEVAPTGFDGEITMMVGIDASGKVLGVKIISHTETAGLGAVAAADNDKGEAFRSQFVGKDSALSVGADIDAMTGATITSKAVTQGVSDAIAAVKLLSE